MTTDDEIRAGRLALAERLGAELVRLGMRAHLPLLRRYYRVVRAGAEPSKPVWSHAHVVELAQTLRVPPHHEDLEIRPRAASCMCATPKTFTLTTFPGGCRTRCASCGRDWLELDPV